MTVDVSGNLDVADYYNAALKSAARRTYTENTVPWALMNTGYPRNAWSVCYSLYSVVAVRMAKDANAPGREALDGYTGVSLA